MGLLDGSHNPLLHLDSGPPESTLLHPSTAGRYPPLDTGDAKVSSSFLGYRLRKELLI